METTASVASDDDFADFIFTDNVRIMPNNFDGLLNYWNDRYYNQPALARFALDMLAVPAITSECERTFSSLKILLNDRRGHLHIESIEASECSCQ